MVLPKEKMIEYYDKCVSERLAELRREIQEVIRDYGFNFIGLTGAKKITDWLGFEAAIKFHESPIFITLKITDPVEICVKMRSGELEDKIEDIYEKVAPRLVIGGFSIDEITHVEIMRGGSDTYLLYVDDPLNCVVSCTDTVCAEVEDGELKPRETEERYGEEIRHYILGCNQPVLLLDTRNFRRWRAMWI